MLYDPWADIDIKVLEEVDKSTRLVTQADYNGKYSVTSKNADLYVA